MRRHIIDQPRKRSNSALKLAFSRIEAKHLPRRTTLMLQRRARGGDAGPMAREFARIERGQTV